MKNIFLFVGFSLISLLACKKEAINNKAKETKYNEIMFKNDHSIAFLAAEELGTEPNVRTISILWN